MRFQDFSSSKKLLEAAQTDMERDLEVIEKELSSAVKSDRFLVQKTNGLLQLLINKATMVINRNRHKQRQNPGTYRDENQLNEDIATYSLIDELNDKIATICIEVPNCDPIVGTFRETIAKLRATVDGAFEASKAEGRAEAEKAVADFMKLIDEKLAKLAQKIDGFVIPNYQAAGLKRAEINKLKTREKTQHALVVLFDGLFREKIKNNEITQDEALQFATADRKSTRLNSSHSQ